MHPKKNMTGVYSATIAPGICTTTRKPRAQNGNGSSPNNNQQT
ncbi:hypothetical protein HMPREF1981_02178 [Bacteroides pyogenes F0041]|uniref:Uncharacterized protein n=1 Tax=Bacteroides pyogenes F0041 TaxID=1321819 RepID=U2DSY8_9BACE|nr:hypothetical protein HMPREF1981_02178 [Bacteroides pyogenes F0041]